MIVRDRRDFAFPVASLRARGHGVGEGKGAVVPKFVNDRGADSLSLAMLRLAGFDCCKSRRPIVDSERPSIASVRSDSCIAVVAS